MQGVNAFISNKFVRLTVKGLTIHIRYPKWYPLRDGIFFLPLLIKAPAENWATQTWVVAGRVHVRHAPPHVRRCWRGKHWGSPGRCQTATQSPCLPHLISRHRCSWQRKQTKKIQNYEIQVQGCTPYVQTKTIFKMKYCKINVIGLTNLAGYFSKAKWDRKKTSYMHR